jgi:hypothetical protein
MEGDRLIRQALGRQRRGRLGLAYCGVEDPHQLGPVRSFPLDLPTAGALVKLLERAAGPLCEPPLDRRLRSFPEAGVTPRAARERSQWKRAEAREHLHELPVRGGLADEVPVYDGLALEKTPVPRQQDSTVAAGQLDELVVTGVACP